MSARTVTVVGTGVANTASVVAALERCSARAEITTDRDRIERAQALVLPGVGAFEAGMARLRDADLVEVIRGRVEERRPTLAVCLGLQLLCRSSDESPEVPGIGAIDAEVGAFTDGVQSPQLGWNRVEAGPECALVKPGYAYFANSFRVADAPEGWGVGWVEHGGRFVAALERGGVLACQFHPELSAAWGLSLITSWLQSCKERATC